MHRIEFYAECAVRTLLVSQVLEESHAIRCALTSGNDEEVKRLLDEFA